MAARVVAAIPRSGNVTTSNAGFVLTMLLLAAVGGFGCWLIGTRPMDNGTDTGTYAAFFERFNQGVVLDTRLEPGFVFVSWVINRLGLDLVGYQTSLFALLLLTIWAGTRRYFNYLGGNRGYLTFLCASLMLLYLSPMFVNASINTVRQGLAALLVFSALLSFQQKRWWPCAVFGAIASSLHLSSLLYLAFAPILLLRASTLRYVAVVAFLAYCTGLSMALVRTLLPPVYAAVMSYAVNPDYRTGVRLDFAAFAVFWYALPHLFGPWVHAPYRERIKDSMAVYLVMLLPFFAVGWAYFSNRYLLPAWLAASLVLAAMLCNSRFALARNPLLIRLGLVASCGAFYYYVTHFIII